MRVIEGGNFSHTRGVAYPIRVTEPTTYRGANFAQAAPHTAIFEVAEGAALRFEGCNLVNVTVPDGAVIEGCNNAQVIPTPTGNPDRPVVNLLHPCEKCATFTKAVRVEIAAGRFQKHRRIDLVKEVARARRGKAEGAVDLAEIAAENAAALAKWER